MKKDRYHETLKQIAYQYCGIEVADLTWLELKIKKIVDRALAHDEEHPE